jgi:hypothetical protein
VGTSTSATNSSLSLTSGTEYYVTVRATNGAGLQASFLVANSQGDFRFVPMADVRRVKGQTGQPQGRERERDSRTRPVQGQRPGRGYPPPTRYVQVAQKEGPPSDEQP